MKPRQKEEDIIDGKFIFGAALLVSSAAIIGMLLYTSGNNCDAFERPQTIYVLENGETCARVVVASCGVHAIDCGPDKKKYYCVPNVEEKTVMVAP